MINKIVSRQNQRILYACLLKEEKNRRIYKQFLMEGRLALEMGLKKNLVKEIFTLSPLEVAQKDVVVNLVDKKVMDKLSSERNPEGIVFISDIPDFEDQDYKKIIYLDHISDPGNMGTIIRTALGLGMDAIYISNGSVSLFNDKVLAASKGAIYEMPIFFKEIDDLVKAKAKGYQIISTALKGNTVDVSELKVKTPFICVFGNESRGVDEKIISLSDVTTKIEIKKIDSFNVAISAGIIMYHLK
ncbi:MAG: RNA methyltransferase [Erysipelotrichaceae bacterium]|nr:RNA methyltransferase [Erysipelotrichaceae bacterium]